MIEFNELDKVTIMLQAKAYALGYQDSLSGLPHVDRGDFYNQGYSDAYCIQQQQTHNEEKEVNTIKEESFRIDDERETSDVDAELEDIRCF